MNYKSIAVWPDGTVTIPNNESEDTHEDYESAKAVCKLLRRDGFGGNGRVFPISTRVERTVKSLPSYEKIKEWADKRNFVFVCGMVGGNRHGCLITALFLMENPGEDTDSAISWAINQFGEENMNRMWNGFDCSTTPFENNPYYMYGFNARNVLFPRLPKVQ